MKIKRVIELCLILLILTLFATTASAAVLINEFLPNGPAPEPDSEWIELYNNGTSSVYLTSWTINNNYAGTFTFPATLIPAQGFVVLAYNATLFNATHTSNTAQVIDYGSSSPGLIMDNVFAGYLRLYDSLNNQQDSINFAVPAENTSWGRRYDGATTSYGGSGAYVQFTSPTPGTYNNRQPVISNIPDQTWQEDNTLPLNLSNYITDADNDQLKFYTGDELRLTIDDDGTATFEDRLVIPTGNTAARMTPSIQGSIRFNTTENAFEGYDGSNWGTPMTVDSAGAVGYFSSLAVANGNPAISYFDNTNADLKYAYLPTG